MTAFTAPVVATAGSPDPAAPLVVLLHGRGSNERDSVGLAQHLPDGRRTRRSARRSVRVAGTPGSPTAASAARSPESLRETMDWFRGWLDTVAPKGRPVVLIGFSGGAAFAGGVLLDDPARYAGAAVLYGTLSFDAGVPTTPARLAGVPVVVAQGEQDTVIPRELLDRTWDYLHGDSGAGTTALRHPAGHGITPDSLELVAGWLDRILTHDHARQER